MSGANQRRRRIAAQGSDGIVTEPSAAFQDAMREESRPPQRGKPKETIMRLRHTAWHSDFRYRPQVSFNIAGRA